MDTKLTLKLDSYIIKRAKTYARKENTSLSSLVESYLNLLTDPRDERDETTPLVKSISGVISVPKNFDEKSSYKSHIAKKYSK